MHGQMEDFVARCRSQFPGAFVGVSVLEIGSYDINGSVRKFFATPTEYVGVDLIPGPGVDLIAAGHTVDLGRQFDVVISTECFEHNPFWQETFVNMAGHARAGGLIIMTCASTGRAEHGTSRSNPADSPGTIQQGWEYYKNLTEADFAAVMELKLFSTHAFEFSSSNGDLYFWGIKT